MNVHMTYDGQNLNMTITDALTLASWSHSWVVNIPAQIGGSTGYVGFTGSTGGASASQKLTSWTYLAGFPPVPNYPAGFDPVNTASATHPVNTIDFSQGFIHAQAWGQMHFNGSTDLDDSRLQLTNSRHYEAASAFYSTPVSISAFTTDFTFQLSDPVADGITFTIQGVGPTALGGDESNLGYGGIKNSVAIKFDINNNAGEGNDSTGLYLNGAIPTAAGDPPGQHRHQPAQRRPDEGPHHLRRPEFEYAPLTDAVTPRRPGRTRGRQYPRTTIGGFYRLRGIHRQYRRRSREPGDNLLDLSRRIPSRSHLSRTRVLLALNGSSALYGAILDLPQAPSTEPSWN